MERFSQEYLDDLLDIGTKVVIEDPETSEFDSLYMLLYGDLEQYYGGFFSPVYCHRVRTAKVTRQVLGFCEDDGPPNYRVSYFSWDTMKNVTLEISEEEIIETL